MVENCDIGCQVGFSIERESKLDVGGLVVVVILGGIEERNGQNKFC